MKPNDNRFGDPALQEALRKIQQDIDATPLPADFKERVMNHIREEKPTRQHLATRRTAFFMFRRVAAAVLIVATVGSIAYAAFRMMDNSWMPYAWHVNNDSIAPTDTMKSHSDEVVLFDNVRLDSIVTAVALHYDRKVCFVDEELCNLRLSTIWKKDSLLAAFISTINEFDGLRLTDECDTIFVKSIQTEEEE